MLRSSQTVGRKINHPKVPSKGKKGPKKKSQMSEEGKCHQRSWGSPSCSWSFTPSENLRPGLEEPLLPVVPPGCRGNGTALPGAGGEEEGRVKVIPAVVAVSRLGLALQAPCPRKQRGQQGPAPIPNPALARHNDEGHSLTSSTHCVTLNKSLPFPLKWGV